MKTVLSILFFVSLLFGSLASDLVPAAERFIPYLKGDEYSTIPRDGRFDLDMEPVFQALSRSIEHRAPSVDESFDAEKRITGSFLFEPNRGVFSLELYLFDGDSLIAKSGKLDISGSISEAVPDYQSLFDGGVEEKRLLFRGEVGDRIREHIRNHRIPTLLIQNDKFAITGANGRSLNWREEIIIEKLNSLVGVRPDHYSPARILFDSTGTLHITAGTIEQRLPSLVRYSSYTIPGKRHEYLTPVRGDAAFQYERTRAKIPMEYSIIENIEFFFKSDYPALFSNFSAQRLLSLFPEKDRASILSGAVSRSAGSETVRYSWVTPRNWVNGLERIRGDGGRFRVECRVQELIQDPHAPQRFWAVVHQQWRTFAGSRERYSDEGLLLVNFDFSPQGKINEVKLHYRLWFYSYPEDGAVTGRGDQIRQDVSRGLSRVAGVDASLKKAIEETILNSMTLCSN